MRLNHDCLRDILLYIEENTSDKVNTISIKKLISDLPEYDKDTIFYHIRQIGNAGLVDHVGYGEGLPIDTTCLSWQGHEYVDNIRDNKIWSKIKSSTKGFASISMPLLVKYAETVAMSFLPKP